MLMHCKAFAEGFRAMLAKTAFYEDLSKITDVSELKDLRKPDTETDGLMPRVLNAIRLMRQRTDFPVGVTDCQGPLTTALQVLGYDKLIYWMFAGSKLCWKKSLDNRWPRFLITGSSGLGQPITPFAS